MHWPKVCARTATPVSIAATSVTPGIANTAEVFCTFCTEPLIVGGRQIMVGLASLISRSIAYFFRPVTARSTERRFCGVPMTENSELGLRSTDTCVVLLTEAR